MIHQLTKYFLDTFFLDNISVSAIENEVIEAPYMSLNRMLLAKKISNFSNQQLMLVNNDRVWMHYLKNNINHIPEVKDITGLNLNFKEEAVQNSTTSEVLDKTETNENLYQNVDHEKDLIMLDQSQSSEYKKPTTTISQSESENHNYLEKETLKKSIKKKTKKFKLYEFSGISTFSKWLLSFKEDDIEKHIKKEEKAARKKALGENAKKSVTKSPAIISEPLAEILASQGHLDEAKKMYEQLIVKNPEKSIYFASKINTLLKL